MLGYGVRLKSKEAIEELCYSLEDGSLCLDGIGFDWRVLNINNFITSKVIGVVEYDTGLYAYKVENSLGKKTYIHFSWVYSIDGSRTTAAQEEVGRGLVRITSKHLINLTTGEVTLTADMPLCSCGNVATTTLPDGTKKCKKCMEEIIKVHSYSYKPEYSFIGSQLGKDTANPVWYGLEVEVSTDKEKLAELMYNHSESLYLKDDSSIRGGGFKVEIVSHPHSFTNLMSSGSWLNSIASIPTEESDSNGCHIHISRTAFVDDRHYGLFYFLIHSMEDIATKVGGRELTRFCQINPTGKIFTKKNEITEGRGRSLFLNELPSSTVEARFFKGTTTTANLKAYVQFIESLIKYTKYCKTTVSIDKWFQYMTGKSKKYSELITKLGTVESTTKNASVIIYRAPIVITKLLTELTATELDNITTIILKNGTVLSSIEVDYVHARDRMLRVRNHGSIAFSDIKEIKLEE